MAPGRPGGMLRVAQEEVIDMLTEPKTIRPAIEVVPRRSREDERLRALAIKQAERIRNFKVHLGVFLVGMPVVTAIWALTEYMNADGWPERLSDSAGEGSWNPWIFWVLLIWGGLLAFEGVKAWLGGPPSEAEIDRELKRLKTGR
jgi:hypothetical protein